MSTNDIFDADTIRKISDNSINSDIKKRIKAAAEQGKYEITIIDGISDSDKIALEHKGFVVKPTGDYRRDTNISWTPKN